MSLHSQNAVNKTHDSFITINSNYILMKMKILRRHALTLFLATGFLSCSDGFLDVVPEQGAEAGKAIVDLPSMNAALNGMYSLLQSQDYYGRTFIVTPELVSNNGMISQIHSSRYTNINLNTVVSTDSYITALWNQLYALTVNANLLITKGEALTLPQANVNEAKKVLGEAYALRALGYFDLVRAFAQPFNNTPDASHMGVPLILESGTSKDNIAKPPRNTVAQVYDAIIADLKKAIELLTEQSATQPTRITLNGAKALLAKVYLYQEKWELAEEYATEVLTDGGYSLLSNSSLVNGFKTKANTEVIFEIANNTADNEGTNSVAYFYLQEGYGDMIGTEDLYNSYTVTDVRRQFVTRGKRDRVGGEEPAYLISKYTNISDYEENVKILRLAEIYLIRAEARARQTDKESLAIDDLYEVARRADLGAYRSIATGDPLIAEILKERRKELAFEGNQLFDLNRTKTNWTKFRSGAAVTSYTAQSNRTIFPIPRRELNLNPNIRQNTGY